MSYFKALSMTVIAHHESDSQGGAGLSVFSAISTLVVGCPNFLSDRHLVKWLEDETNH
jgi:heme/copper-type cytochrome/quinol oxidase subunit 1